MLILNTIEAISYSSAYVELDVTITANDTSLTVGYSAGSGGSGGDGGGGGGGGWGGGGSPIGVSSISFPNLITETELLILPRAIQSQCHRMEM